MASARRIPSFDIGTTAQLRNSLTVWLSSEFRGIGLDFPSRLLGFDVCMFFDSNSLFKRYQQQCADVPGFVVPESLATWHCLLAFQRQNGVAAPLMEIGVYYGLDEEPTKIPI